VPARIVQSCAAVHRTGIASLLLACALGCQEQVGGLPHFEPRLPPERVASREDPFEPIPESVDVDRRKAELGRRLFADPLLSGDGKRRCTDCHDLGSGGVIPGEARSNHPMNETGPYNVPTVFNVGFNFRYNWNGKFATLEAHLGGLMMAPTVMAAGSWPELLERLRPTYDEGFKQAGYPGGISERGFKDALSAYQRSLVTPNAKFDRFLKGEAELAPAERDGYELFKRIGCASCHQGINVGGNLFQRFGVMEDPFDGRAPTPNDYGRMLVTGRQEDAHVFRVPSLRNVEVTAPYFHDGSAPTLEVAVQHMGRVQLGTMLTAGEIDQIVAFLRTLTGEIDGKRLGSP
jgi:cytochrome c peroxidase